MRVTIVRNPRAGRARQRQRGFDTAVGLLRRSGWAVTVATTTAAGIATEIARQAVENGADAIIAAGGDGTINEIVQALAGTSCALGCLPLGTVNIWAQEVGYPQDPVGAALAMLGGKISRVDLGSIGERYFLLMAGVGFDAAVTMSLRGGQRHKQYFGIVPYVLRTASLVPRYRGAWVTLDIDGQTRQQHAVMMVVSNTRLYAGVTRLTPNAVANDGELDVRLFDGAGPADTLRHLVPFMFGRSAAADGAIIRARTLSITADPPQAVHVDGEPFGMTPIEIRVVPGALQAIVPAAFHTSLLGEIP